MVHAPIAPSVSIVIDNPVRYKTKAEEHAADAAAGGKAPCDRTETCVQNCAAWGRICPGAARIAGGAAARAMMQLKRDSSVFSPDSHPHFTFVNREDVVIEEKLGEGGFSNVHRCVVRGIDPPEQEFALKFLKRKTMLDPRLFKLGAADLATEACFLDFLNHPNIVMLHGIAAGSVETNLASGQVGGFFILVDLLVETLEQRLSTWRAQQQRHVAPRFAWLSSEYKQQKRAELYQRIEVAVDIANVMQYLHSLGIVFRDLKPNNIGFDQNGVLKFFDFGMAKELKLVHQTDVGSYKLTGNCGSMRYMAPEVARAAPYNQSVDVYSFGILLWELCSGEKAFGRSSRGNHLCQVVYGGERPPLDAKRTEYWPANLIRLMQRCWSPSPQERPSSRVIAEVLQDILDGKENVPMSLELHSSKVSINVDPVPRFFFQRKKQAMIVAAANGTLRQ